MLHFNIINNIMNTSINYKQLAKIGGVLLAGFLLGWLIFGDSDTESDSLQEHVEEIHTTEEGDRIYTCSMHPQIRENEPGNCPICGMELIPLEKTEKSSATQRDEYAITMSPTAMELAKVKTVEVVEKAATKKVRMPGKVKVDERRKSVIPAHFPGRIEELYLDYTGAYLEEGDPIASVYAPELVAAQRELLEAYQNRDTNPGLYRATRQKLRNWEIAPEVIDKIIRSGRARQSFDIFATRNGYVTTRHISTGDHIEFGNAIFEIADLSTVWIELEAYERDLNGLSEGDKVEFTVGAFPGEQFHGTINYIDPMLDDETRTATVRAEAQNPSGRLKPNMLVKGFVTSSIDEGEPQLQIPTSAVLWTGLRSLVYIQQQEGAETYFEPREIMLGERTDDMYVIKDGLEAGERVVIQGNFMIDSAAQLADKRSMMNHEPGSGSVPAHDHGEMDMEE
jgi:Cu(I)/Ag(I) efflux system membrane fusion protein